MKFQTASLTRRVAWALTLLSAAAIASGQQSQIATEFYGGHEVVANEVLIRFAAPSAEIARASIDREQDVNHSHGVGDGHIFVLHSRTRGASALVTALRSRKDLAYVEPNYVIHADGIPNDSEFGTQWGMRNTGQSVNGVTGTPGADISATLAWDVTTGSKANVVAVVDTGTDYTHPDLAANVWSAPVSFNVTIGGMTMTCPAGSHGFNAVNNTFDPMDDYWHGTHCSGTIGAIGNNGVGVAGLNWTASVMACKFIDASGNGTTSGAINAIEFAIQAKQALGSSANVRVLSNSWGGGGFSQALLDEINRANNNAMLFCAAAGNAGTDNDASPFYPAGYNAPNIVAVAATTSTDARASFSNYGATTVHLGAPGDNILSTGLGGSYGIASGTSMATPHVSGAAALVLAANPNLTTAQVKSAILNNVDPIASLAGLTVTGGRLNVNRAVRSVLATPDFEISASPASQTVVQGAGTSYGVTVTGTNGFSGEVGFTVSGLPNGASATFTPATVTGSGSSTLNVATSSLTPAGSYSLTVTGVGAVVSHSATVTLVVTPPSQSDFTLTASPSTQSIKRGGVTDFTVTLGSVAGFGGTVSLSASGLAAGTAGTFSPVNITASGSSTFHVTTLRSTPTGKMFITITGTSGSQQHSVTVQVNVRK